MYPWQLICSVRQMIRFVNKLRGMPHTTLARMAMCDAIADFRNNHHNNWFAQLVSFCDRIRAPVLYVGTDMGDIPLLDEAHCIASLQAVYHGVFTSAGSSKPRIQKYHATFACQLPPQGKYWRAQPYLCTALSTSQASVIARFRLSSHHLACETGMWRRTGVDAEPNVALATQCHWCSSDGERVVQDEQHVFFGCQHFQHLRVTKPRLCQLTREASLWKLFNEYDVPHCVVFATDSRLMYSSSA